MAGTTTLTLVTLLPTWRLETLKALGGKQGPWNLMLRNVPSTMATILPLEFCVQQHPRRGQRHLQVHQ